MKFTVFYDKFNDGILKVTLKFKCVEVIFVLTLKNEGTLFYNNKKFC